MADLDLAALTRPIADQDPCGPDLDAADDDDYMNIMVTTETILPSEYMVADYKGVRQPFDQDERYAGIDFAGQIRAARPAAERTRDLRLLLLLAKLFLLSRNIAGFALCVEAIAVLLETHWDAVHPRIEGGNSSVRVETLQRLDDPLIVAALEHAPIFVNKRFGPVSFHRYTAEVKRGQAAGAEPDTSGFDKTLADENQSDIGILMGIREALVGAHDTLDRLCKALARIRLACAEHLDYRAPKIEAVPALAGKLLGLVDRVYRLTEAAIVRLDPGAAREPLDEAPPEEAIGSGAAAAQPPSQAGANGALADAAAATRALAAATSYFRALEPSNPALLLLGQAQALIGKSFLEAMHILVPDQVPKATLTVGVGVTFSLPLTRLAETIPIPASPAGPDDPQAGPQTASCAKSRAEAVALLDQVGSYFRIAEPSSPIPLLTDRARAMAGKDFAALLGDILPKEPPPPAKK